MNTTFFNIREGQLVNKFSVKKAFDLKDGRYELSIKKTNRRSNPQNAYFHAMLPDIQKGLYNAGYREVKTAEDAKEVVKYLFLKTAIKNDETGEAIPTVKHTHKLTKEEMSVFIDEIIQWAAQYLNITLFHPNEQSLINFSE